MRCLIGMQVSIAVDLKRQPGFIAIEVQNVGSERMLSPKPGSCDAAPANRRPQDHLREGEFAPKLPGAVDGQLWGFHLWTIGWV
ncbi:hypothetical protein IP78_13490 [Brevundimonas sp. AAP58]|nr:hypothetical protein IP78_13490 [Brevundimonas sp. AAP58]